jgi:hypothetical protein
MSIWVCFECLTNEYRRRCGRRDSPGDATVAAAKALRFMADEIERRRSETAARLCDPLQSEL